jgi:hypothetical protein
MILGAGVRADSNRTLPASGGVRDFAADGFPNIKGDEVMTTQAGLSLAPTVLSVVLIQLKK